MGTLDFSGLKIKLVGSIVAISAISLLRAFMTITQDNVVDEVRIFWLVILHVTFVVSGLREVIVNGLSLAEQIPTVLGLGVWLAIGLSLAIRLFRWKEVAA